MLAPVEIEEDALKVSLGRAELSFRVLGALSKAHISPYSAGMELGSWVPHGRSDVWSRLRPAANQCLK